MNNLNNSELVQGTNSDRKEKAIKKVTSFLQTTNYKVKDSMQFLISKGFVKYIEQIGNSFYIQTTESQDAKILEENGEFNTFHYSDRIE